MPSPGPERLPLLKYQKNEIYREIQSAGLPVSDFQLVAERWGGEWGKAGVLVAVIRHPATGSLFGMLETRTGSPAVPVKPGLARQARYAMRSQVGKAKIEARLFVFGKMDLIRSKPWHQVLARIRKWVRKVADFVHRTEEYEEIPDLWEQLSRSWEFLDGQAEETLDNTPFTTDEGTAISAQLKQIREYITTTHELTAEQISHLDARLEHAEEASKRIGRKDWLMAFNGAVFSLMLADLITPDTAQHVILMALHGLSHLFGIGGPPPHLPPG